MRPSLNCFSSVNTYACVASATAHVPLLMTRQSLCTSLMIFQTLVAPECLQTALIVCPKTVSFSCFWHVPSPLVPCFNLSWCYCLLSVVPLILHGVWASVQLSRSLSGTWKILFPSFLLNGGQQKRLFIYKVSASKRRLNEDWCQFSTLYFSSRVLWMPSVVISSLSSAGRSIQIRI